MLSELTVRSRKHAMRAYKSGMSVFELESELMAMGYALPDQYMVAVLLRYNWLKANKYNRSRGVSRKHVATGKALKFDKGGDTGDAYIRPRQSLNYGAPKFVKPDEETAPEHIEETAPEQVEETAPEHTEEFEVNGIAPVSLKTTRLMLLADTGYTHVIVEGLDLQTHGKMLPVRDLSHERFYHTGTKQTYLLSEFSSILKRQSEKKLYFMHTGEF